jgi:hypothetical protein
MVSASRRCRRKNASSSSSWSTAPSTDFSWSTSPEAAQTRHVYTPGAEQKGFVESRHEADARDPNPILVAHVTARTPRGRRDDRRAGARAGARNTTTGIARLNGIARRGAVRSLRSSVILPALADLWHVRDAGNALRHRWICWRVGVEDVRPASSRTSRDPQRSPGAGRRTSSASLASSGLSRPVVAAEVLSEPVSPWLRVTPQPCRCRRRWSRVCRIFFALVRADDDRRTGRGLAEPNRRNARSVPSSDLSGIVVPGESRL